MNIRNCPECGQLFNFIRTNLCPACQAKEEESFRVIRKYIAQNPGVSAMDVSKGTGIKEEIILSFLREGRLSSGVSKQVKFECELCGASAFGGRYCPPCQEKLTAGLKKVVQEENKKILEERQKEAEQKGTRMFTADMRRKK